MPVIAAPTIPAPEGFKVETVVLDPEQLIMATYGPAFDDDGNEREPTPEEEAKMERYRAEIKEQQLHRYRTSMTSTADQTRKVVQSKVFPPGEASSVADELSRLLLAEMHRKAEALA